jgi:16S rRNA (uracil1498-N3)-methyltransferase
VEAPTPLAEWVAMTEADYKFCLHPGLQSVLPATTPSSVALLIGPEGGLSDDEVAVAIDGTFLGLNVGPRILRTETAPLVALSVIGTQWGDLRAI